MTTTYVANKILEVREEMKQAGIWKKEPPPWVTEYENGTIESQNDFSEWLQFVYLPNLMTVASSGSVTHQKNTIVPQAIKFFGEDVKKGKLLQLLIELDACI